MDVEWIAGGVVALRFFVPLLILRYPIPGMVGAILADAIDGALLANYTDLSLARYQYFDKAFDTYYLAIAYVAMLRNWNDPTAVAIGRMLWYYRLIGVALFTMTENRTLLFVFPAAFEVYFIVYELVRLRWRAERLALGSLLALAGLAWLAKVPQEYWLHVAGRSTTAWAKQTVFGMDPSTPRPEVIAANLWIFPVAVAAVVAVVLVVRQALRWLPPADHPTRFDADAHGRRPGGDDRHPAGEPMLSAAVVDKVALLSLLGIVFAEFLPSVDTTALQVTIGVTFLVIANAAVSLRLARTGVSWRSPAAQFLLMCAINAPLVSILVLLARRSSASIGASGALAFLVLASLLVGLHDRYRDAGVGS